MPSSSLWHSMPFRHNLVKCQQESRRKLQNGCDILEKMWKKHKFCDEFADFLGRRGAKEWMHVNLTDLVKRYPISVWLWNAAENEPVKVVITDVSDHTFDHTLSRLQTVSMICVTGCSSSRSAPCSQTSPRMSAFRSRKANDFQTTECADRQISSGCERCTANFFSLPGFHLSFLKTERCLNDWFTKLRTHSSILLRKKRRRLHAGEAARWKLHPRAG